MINNLNILPIYEIELQGKPFFDKQRSIAYCQQYEIYTEMQQILPFQIQLEGLNHQVAGVTLYKSNGDVVIQNILQYMESAGLVIEQDASGLNDILVFRSIAPMALNLIEGYYYIDFEVQQNQTNPKRYNSEIFHMMPNLDNFLKLEYFANDEIEYPFGTINFAYPFKFRMYINTDIGRPDYKTTNEELVRDGITFYRKQLSQKVFKFAFIAPEYICDALRLAPLCENKKLTDQYGNEYYLKTMKLDVSFDSGYFAKVKCEFSIDDVIKRTPQRYPQESYEDFNNDYNNDYAI